MGHERGDQYVRHVPKREAIQPAAERLGSIRGDDKVDVRPRESFNQPLDSWTCRSGGDLDSMFYYAYAFDQDLGWCLAEDAAFSSDWYQGTACLLPKCGIAKSVGRDLRADARPLTPIQTSAAGAVAHSGPSPAFAGAATPFFKLYMTIDSPEIR